MALGYDYNKQVKPILGQMAPQQPAPQPAKPDYLAPVKNYTSRVSNTIQTGMNNAMKPSLAQNASSIAGNYGTRIGEQVKSAMDGQQGSANPFARAGITNPVNAPAQISQAPTTQTETINRQAPTTQQTGLQDQGSITEAGGIYNQRVLDNLKNGNPLGGQAQAIGDRNIARRNYQTWKQTTENMAQSPFSAGSSQYQRAMVEGRAGANQANLAEQSQVNTFKRGLNEKAMADAQGLEDTTRANAIGERGYGDQTTSRYSNLITDPKAKLFYNKLMANGMTAEQAFQEITRTSKDGGAINEAYRGQSNLELNQMKADDFVRLTNPGLSPDSPEFKELSSQYSRDNYNTQGQPITDATRQREIDAIVDKVNSGDTLSDTDLKILQREDIARPTPINSMPTGKEGVEQWLAENPKGMVNIEGKIYRVLNGNSYTVRENGKWVEKSYVKVLDNGVEKYISNGKMSEDPSAFIR